MKYSILILLLCVSVSMRAQSTNKLVERFVNHLKNAEYADAYACLGDTVKRMVNEEQLEPVWEMVSKTCSGLKGVNISDADITKGYHVHIVDGICEQGGLRMSVSVDSVRQKIVGFYMLPRKAEGTVPSYAQLEKFTERKLNFGLDDFPIQGTLTVPTGVVNPPVVILVHGSGPNDRDETLESNKVFRDLAWGLASMGVAVFRYDKRTYLYGKRMAEMQRKGNPFTVDDEVTDDAVMAVKLMKASDLVDGNNVFVLGHSLGGMMAPRIAQQSKPRGIVLTAAPARKLDVLLEEQYRFLSIGKLRNAADSAQLEEMITVVRKSGNSKQLESLNPDSLALGLSPAYWKSINEYNQVQTAQKFKGPILVLSGGRDYQVPQTDATIWKQSLPLSQTVCIEYPKANHLMMDGEGRPSPNEYAKPNNVNRLVVVDIASWLKANLAK